jgi:hypothetical protein
MAHIFLIVPTKGIVFVVIELYHYFCDNKKTA